MEEFMKNQEAIDAIKERINDMILVLPGYSRCERCEKVAHITRKVPGEWADLKVCLTCAQEAEKLGLVVVEI
jgi:anthranilate/para-aminobenzoate synthase component II